MNLFRICRVIETNKSFEILSAMNKFSIKAFEIEVRKKPFKIKKVILKAYRNYVNERTLHDHFHIN